MKEIYGIMKFQQILLESRYSW